MKNEASIIMFEFDIFKQSNSIYKYLTNKFTKLK